MPQELHIGEGRYITGILRSFRDGGEPAKRGLFGGEVVQISEGRRAAPTIVQTKDGYFYEDGKPLTNLAHVAHIKPDSVREQMVAWIKKHGPSAKPLKAQRKRRPEVGPDGRPESPEATAAVGESGAPLRRGHQHIDSESALRRHGGGGVDLERDES
jgi:hypothetical protein